MHACRLLILRIDDEDYTWRVYVTCMHPRACVYTYSTCCPCPNNSVAAKLINARSLRPVHVTHDQQQCPPSCMVTPAHRSRTGTARTAERESVDTPLYLYVGTRQLACIVACVHTCMVHACMQMQQPLAVPLLPPLASAKLTACRPVPSQEKLHPGTVPDTRAPLP